MCKTKKIMDKYNQYSDEQLVELYKNGDQLAFDQIHERYKNAVRSEANKYYLRGGNKDDLLQEGTIGLAKAVMNYNGQNSFGTFAFTCIKNNIKTAVISSAKQANIPLNDGLPLDGTEVDGVTAEDPLDGVIENETAEECINEVKSLLSDMEKRVLDLALQGYGYKEIAEITDESPKAVDNALQRIRNKLKARGE